MMDAEFIGAIERIAQEAANVSGKVAMIPGIPKSYFTKDENGEVAIHRIPFDEASQALSLSSLCGWLEEEVGEIWYSRSAAVAFKHLDEEVKPDSCKFDMPFSKQFAKLIEIYSRPDGVAYSQAELWHLLRTVFVDCLPSHANLIQKIGRVDIKKVAESTAVQRRDGVSLSRSMVAEAAGANELPETLVFDVPVYEIAAVRIHATVRCAFALDSQSERFQLHVLPGEIEKVYSIGESAVYSILAEKLADVSLYGDVEVFNGIKILL